MTRVVRQATVDDIWTVHEIARESWHAVYDDVLGSETVDDVVDDWYAIGDLESAISTTESRDDAAFIVAETASNAASADEAGCRAAPELDGFAHVVPWPEDTAVAFLACLYVRPAVWDEGTGTALLETIETSLAPGFDRVRLPILTDNEIGIFFSESRGFDRVETRSSGLAAGLEEYVYEKEL